MCLVASFPEVLQLGLQWSGSHPMQVVESSYNIEAVPNV